MTARKEEERRGGEGGERERGRGKVRSPLLLREQSLFSVFVCFNLCVCVCRALRNLHNLKEVDQSELESI